MLYRWKTDIDLEVGGTIFQFLQLKFWLEYVTINSTGREQIQHLDCIRDFKAKFPSK